MMRPTLARFLAVFLCLLLPLQAAAALEMSARTAFAHGQGGTAMVDASMAAADEHASHCPHETPAPVAVDEEDCPTSCVVCHFACTGFMPAVALAAAGRPAGHVLVPILRILADQVAPDGLRRPPRAAA